MNTTLKPNYYQSSTKVAKNSFISFVTATLILLITFNLGWLLMLLKVSSRLTTIKNVGRTIFSLELLLFWGNFSLIMLSIGLGWGIQKISYCKKI